jgi:putative (di)nucleoside polyphosphate hydrolase
MSDVYRSAASVLLLRPTEVCTRDGCKRVYQILLIHKPRKQDAWQLPQGGVESGETIPNAAMRELKEEAGIDVAELFGESDKVYQYDFPPSFRRFRPDNVRGQRIAFVFALCGSDTRVSVDQKEVDSSAWADLSQISLYVKRKEYADLVVDLYGEAVAILDRRDAA